MNVNKGYRCIYDLNVHLVLVTKYRKKVINQALLESLQAIFESTCQKWQSELLEFNGELDHVHMVIAYPPHVQLSKLVNNLKTVSSRLIRKEYSTYLENYYSKAVFWSGAYFAASCGGVTIEQVKHYVQSQNQPID